MEKEIKKENEVPEKEIIRGTYNWMVDMNWDNGWVAAKYEGDSEFKEKYGVKYFTLTGFHLPTIAMQYEFEVEFDANSSYSGRNFKCLSCKEAPKGTKKEALSWLCSSIFDGIGPKKAEKIVSILGDNTIELVKADLNVLKTAGIGEAGLKKIEASYNEYYSQNKKSFAFLQKELGLTDTQAKRIRNKFKDVEDDDFESFIHRNPYELYHTGRIKFPIVDAFALKYGIERCDAELVFPVEKDDHDRIYTGIVEILRQNEASGNTYIMPNELVDRVADLLHLNFFDKFTIQKAIMYELEHNHLGTELYAYNKQAGRGFALKTTVGLEKSVASFVTADNTSPIRKSRFYTDADFLKKVDEVIAENAPENIQLDDSQINAIRFALRNRFSIITGGPGTGKTTITNCIISCYRELTGYDESHIVLLAPTGAAAKRLSDKSGYKARTINSRFLIGVDMEDDEESENSDCCEFFLNANDRNIENALLILDEASMLNLSDAGNFLKYVSKRNVHVVFVGDKDQLPPVGNGSVFVDLLDYFKWVKENGGESPVAYLDVTHRQNEGSGIVSVAQAINRGYYMEARKSNSEYETVPVPYKNVSEMESLIRTEEALIEKALEQIRTHSLNNTMVLCPQNEGICSVQSVNKRLQNVLNPSTPLSLSVTGRFGYEYRVGDRVMHLKNKNNKNIVNGDVGFVTDIQKKGSIKVMVVTYQTPDGPLEYKYSSGNMNEVCLCYAQTVHKSQGSEYESVVMCLNSVQKFSLRRNLLYTGVTRAKSHCTVVGDTEAITRAVGASLVSKRNTKLNVMLKIMYNTNKIDQHSDIFALVS